MEVLNFNKKELSAAEKEKAVLEVKKECLKCASCDLAKGRKNVVFSDGKASAPIMLIGEAPGADEDASGVPFVGRAGKLLNKILADSGISREEEVYICNTVKCRPPENRVPTDKEKQTCEHFLNSQINIVRPKVIILCGATAAKSFLGKNIKISKIRGQWFDLFEGIKTTVIFHPSYLLRNHSTEKTAPRGLTKQDLLAIKEVIS